MSEQSVEKTIDGRPAGAASGEVRTYFVVPGVTEDAAQCRIVVRSGLKGSARASYAAEPGLWREAGLMNARGRLVCFEGPAEDRVQIEECEPLAGGLEITCRPAVADRVSELHRIMRASGDYDSEQHILDTIADMREQVAKGENPEELLHEIGIEPDFVLDLL